MKNIMKFWIFIKRYFLMKLWFWITLLGVLLIITPPWFPLPLVIIGEIILGILISPFVILIIWLVVLTLHTGGKIKEKREDSHPEHSPPAPVAPQKSSKNILGWVCFGLAVIGFVVYLIFFSPSKQKEEPKPIPIVIVKVGKEKTTYRFDNYWDKTIRKTLSDSIEFYPKGGPVKITPPSGHWYIDTPGVAIIRPPERPGEFIIEIPKGSNAWGIEIWEKI